MSNAVSCLTQQFGRLMFNIGLQEHTQLQPPDGSFCVAWANILCSKSAHALVWVQNYITTLCGMLVICKL